MADFSLQDLWWLKPKGPDNPLPAMQLGAQIVQHKAQMDLKERELANDVARTSILRDTQLSKMDIQTKLDAGNAAIAGAIAGVDDWNDPEQIKKVFSVGAKYPMVVGGKAWLGAEYMQRNAIAAKRLEENTQSLIDSRNERADYNNKKLALQELLADHTIPLTDARVIKAQQEAALAERELAVKEANVKLRERDVANKENRTASDKWAPEDRIEFNRRAKVIDDNPKLTPDEKDQTIHILRQNIERQHQQTEKFKAQKVLREGLKTAPPPAAVTPPSVIDPTNRVSVISPDGKTGWIPASQLDEALKAGYKRP